VAPPVGGITAASYELPLLKLVEQGDNVAGIESQRLGEPLLTRRPFLPEQLQGNEVPGPEAARSHGALRSAAPDPSEVLEQRQQSLIFDRLGHKGSHATNNTSITKNW